MLSAMTDHPAISLVRTRLETILADNHQRHHGKHARARVAVVVGLHLFGEMQPDAAGTDHAQDRRASDIDVELEDGIAEEDGKHLWHHGEQEARGPAGAGRGDGLDRSPVDVLDGLRGCLRHEPDGPATEREDSGKRAQPEGSDEDESEDNLVRGAGEHDERPPDGEGQDHARGRRRRRQTGDRDRQDDCQQGSPERHQRGLEQRPEYLRDIGEARHQADDSLGDLAGRPHARPVGAEHQKMNRHGGDQDPGNAVGGVPSQDLAALAKGVLHRPRGQRARHAVQSPCPEEAWASPAPRL